MADTKITHVISTVEGDRRYGKAKLMGQSIIDWLLDGKEGELYLTIEQDGEEIKKTVILKKLPNWSDTVKIGRVR